MTIGKQMQVTYYAECDSCGAHSGGYLTHEGAVILAAKNEGFTFQPVWNGQEDRYITNVLCRRCSPEDK